MSRHEVEMAAVQEDALTVQGLSVRSMDDLDLGDPVVAALAAWVTRIDDGIDETIAFSVGHGAGVKATPETPKGRRAALVAGATVFALVVSGGAAAAVTGDPLLVVKAPLKAISEVNPFDDDTSNARDRLPDQAPAVADANKLLADAQRAMARGDVEEAERLLAEAEALLGDSVNPGQQNRMDKITEDIANTSDRGPKGTKDNGPQNDGPKDRDPKGEKPLDKGPEDKGPKDGDPKGKKAVDKDPKGQKSTAKPEEPVEDDTSTEQNGGSSTGSQRTEDPSTAKPDKPSPPKANG